MKKLIHFTACALLLSPVIPLSAQQTLNVNQIGVAIYPSNILFNNQQQYANYEVPIGSGNHTLYSGNLWLIGQDNNDNLHGIADRYQQSGTDTWTGPLKLDGTATTTQAVVDAFNRVWKVSQTDIDNLYAAQLNGSLISGTYIPPVDVAQWPGNGPVGYAPNLAPYFDANNDGIYNIYDGDRPEIKGETMLFWILNDAHGIHAESGLQTMGVEIHCSYYACKIENPVGDENIVNYTTFLEYKIFNRSTASFHDVYASFNADGDVGYAMDDYIGSHVDANAFYFYNSDAIDGELQGEYGMNSPVQSIQFIEGVANDTNKIMSSFISYSNGISPIGDPQTGAGAEFYNLMKGNFKNGVELSYGGNGYAGSLGVTTVPASYMFSASSDPTHIGTNGIDPGFEWSASSPCPACSQLPGSDVRGVASMGPLTLAAGANFSYTLAFISTFDSTLTINERVEENRRQNKALKQLFDADALPCVLSYSDIDELEGVSELMLYPNPTGSILKVQGSPINLNTNYAIIDVHGKVLLSGKSSSIEMLEIDVQHLSAGIYYIKLSDGANPSRTMKFIKN